MNHVSGEHIVDAAKTKQRPIEIIRSANLLEELAPVSSLIAPRIRIERINQLGYERLEVFMDFPQLDFMQQSQRTNVPAELKRGEVEGFIHKCVAFVQTNFLQKMIL